MTEQIQENNEVLKPAKFDPMKSMTPEELELYNDELKTRLRDEYKARYMNYAVLTEEQAFLHDNFVYIMEEEGEFPEDSQELTMKQNYDKLIAKGFQINHTSDLGDTDEVITTGDILRGVLTMEEINSFYSEINKVQEELDFLQTGKMRKVLKKQAKKKLRVRNVLKNRK